ncbi:MAG: hypothetical protein NT029_18060 [Armatimonadetes bacterium]|nr:hypothetical protein [Armatimonadota bacterium]
MHRFHVLLRAAALVLLGTPLAHRPAAAQNPVRTVLPTDGSVSVYIGVQATWQSLLNANLAPQAKEMATDASVYTLDQTPTRANFVEHALTLMPLSDDADWYAFAPATDDYNLKINILDAAKRLRRVVITDLDTGEALGSIDASADHSAIVGQLSCGWTQPYFRIDGYSTNNTPLFRLAASNGAPDTFVHFKMSAPFEPHQPATVTTPHWTGSGVQTWGPIGNPYSPAGVQIGSTVNSSSQGAGADDGSNDSQNANPLSPPQPYVFYKPKKCIEALSNIVIMSYLSNTTADVPSLAADVEATQTEIAGPALGNYTMAPYSVGTAVWSARFEGMATAFFVVPYRIRVRPNLWAAIGGLSPALAGYLTGAHTGEWVNAVSGALATWLATAQGTASGLRPGMVIPLPNDVKSVTCAQTGLLAPYTAAITQDVTFTLSPNIAPPAGMNAIGSGAITDWTATTTPPPPPMALNATLSFSPYNGVVTRALPKGYQYKANANITFPVGYQGGTLGFYTVPGQTAVTIPCTLTKLFTWRIVTVTESPAPPLPPAPEGPAYVVVKSSAGVPVRDGYSAFVNGHYVCTFLTLEPGAYTVEATRTMVGAPPATYKGTVTVLASAGVEAEDTVTLTRQ